jgi:large subunit ribosomal protein L17
MRHRRAGRRLGRTTSHRKALMRTMVTEFFENEKIITTVSKAKELRPVAEKMITLGKRDTLHARRQALAFIRKKPVVFKLFDSLAPRFADRNGGYTRILRLGVRPGDAAEVALLEFVDAEERKEAARKAAAKKKTSKKASKKKEDTTEAAAPAPEAEEKKPKRASRKKAPAAEAPAKKPRKTSTRKKKAEEEKPEE